MNYEDIKPFNDKKVVITYKDGHNSVCILRSQNPMSITVEKDGDFYNVFLSEIENIKPIIKEITVDVLKQELLKWKQWSQSSLDRGDLDDRRKLISNVRIEQINDILDIMDPSSEYWLGE